MKKLFSKLTHWLGHYMSGHEFLFIDKVSGRSVYRARCIHCKKSGLTDSLFPWAGVFWDDAAR